MATKEDILEQLVEEYLLHQRYLVRNNVKFPPKRDHTDFVSKQDSNHSDIDVVGYHPSLSGTSRVLVVSCKSWQGRCNSATELNLTPILNPLIHIRSRDIRVSAPDSRPRKSAPEGGPQQ